GIRTPGLVGRNHSLCPLSYGGETAFRVAESRAIGGPSTRFRPRTSAPRRGRRVAVNDSARMRPECSRARGTRMRVARALLRRSAAQSGQLAAALAIATVGCAALVVLLVVPAAGIDRGVATLLADAEPTAGALRVETALADDTGAQEAEFDEAFASALGDAPLDVVRAVRSAPLAVGVDGAVRQLVLGAQQDLAGLATLTAGAWPAGDDEVTLAEPAAIALGVTVGDTLELPHGARTVVGIWRALDTGDAAWFSETLVASGRLGDAVGPVIVAESDLAGLESRPR